MGSKPLHSKLTKGKVADFKLNSGRVTAAAVALQDHIARNLQLQNLSLLGPEKKRSKNTVKNCSVKPFVNTGLKHRKLQKCERIEEKEYVLDPSPPTMTLAQRLGLVEAPPVPLTADEWSKAKERSVHQGESDQPCVICKEEFRLQSQVLLSCSHVFHRVCLQAFERFSGRKSCPMCRKEQYETRVIHDGARLYRMKCATRIQACWRGYIVHKWYRHLRKTIPPKDMVLRRKFFEEKLQEMNDRVVRSCDTKVDRFLTEIDNSLASTRCVFHQFDNQFGSAMAEEEWEKIQAKAVQRDSHDCPICITPLFCHIGTTQPCTSSDGEKRLSLRRAVLLSCSHLFHFSCLKAFEDFSVEERTVCPLCRSAYQKRVL
ncbi:RING finger protein 32 isoform X1 [Lepisosteus oculatus]|uniref:RING finger protein 32 isoform X1 n=1 Tax=Lepisosteus oculatus TaxID=7918 RepID=UPI0007405042|nr:PREDICTED: RING finger protein 32 isoform X1 [Lepisosteus oculatus]XP_015210271.1 PREDICTED: RING finger protein 32 isoform X1 [Lepisosteus oculatus]XP_015210272.1 PREDICTED: RING finger protein 32 isoform X1 [Lepisosteus oculatus]XP_015210273.1 PREDICTED: RING finger protein 32 isoform X1 [Lepisosteus oculatus]XP_015210274.1 PREDICTED: RING finger protein 32 isoform X1 [Lepisosteus oculatus]